MPVPTSLATLSQTPASNSPAGSDAVFPLLDDYLREMFADFARLRDGANSWLTGVSGVDTITASCTSIGALVAGQVFRFVAAGANTGAVTLNINGLGAKAVARPGAVALGAGDMPTFAEVGYNGTTFELLNPASSNIIGGSVGSVPYQSAASTTALLSPGAANTVLQSNGASAPSFVAPQSLVASADASTGNNFPRKSQVDALIAASNPDASSTTKGHVELATVGELQSGSGAGLVVDVPTLRSGLIVSATAVATTSGTAVTLDSAVPSWAKRGTICFRGVSLSGTANYLIQLGTSGGFVSTGYSSYFGYVVNDTNANTASSTAGFGISGGNPSGTIHGIMHIALMDTNTWASSHSAGDLGGSGIKHGGGSVDLGAALTQLRITSSGADTFDAGSASVLWE